MGEKIVQALIFRDRIHNMTCLAKSGFLMKVTKITEMYLLHCTHT